MRARRTPALLATLVLVVGIAHAVRAQQVTPFLPPAQPSAKPQPQPSPAEVSPPESQLQSTGVSLDRIRRLLREQPPTPTDSKLRLEYHIEVVGRMPRIDVMSGFNIDKTSAVPYGGMTHAEFLKVVAPPWRRW